MNLMRPLSAIFGWRPGRLAANAVRGTAMYGVRLAVQAVYFVVLARLLETHQFGVFSGVWVLCGFLATLVGLGFPVVVFRTTSLSPVEAPACAGRGLRVVAFTAVPLAALAVLIATYAFPEAPRLATLLLLALSEVTLVPTLTLIAGLHQGNERLGRSRTIFASLWSVRLAGLAIYAASGRRSLDEVVLIHTCITALATMAWLAVDRHHFTSPFRSPNPDFSEVLMGISFALSGAATIAFTELNQSIVLADVGAVPAGLLAVAYKFIMLFIAPLSALSQAISPRLVRAYSGTRAPSGNGRVLVGALLAAGLAISCAVLVASNFLSEIFGSGYQQAERMVRIFAVLPLFTGIRLISVSTLMAASRQWLRVLGELTCLSLGLTLNIVLIKRHGLDGAVSAILLTERSTALLMGALAIHTVRRADKQAEGVR